MKQNKNQKPKLEAELALRERVKELRCLYKTSRIVQNAKLPFDEVINRVLRLIPPSMLHPEKTRAKLLLDGKTYQTHMPKRELQNFISADVVIADVTRGTLYVYYSDDTPFLLEEKSLVEMIANQLAFYIESKRNREEQTRLQEQLRHADRLATIGQLAAGVAHELNEPLGGILGFAQLTKKTPDLPEQTQDDLDRIISATLHAREIVKDLLIFARQAPTNKKLINLNHIIEKSLYFLEHRCIRENIKLSRALDHELPLIEGDSSQLNQVLINLVVNAIQAMPDGGKIQIKTYYQGDYVFLTVQDTGSGMTDDVKKKIFMPFFSTKDVGEGTGLGLSVVHGIVSAHKGTIEVESEEGKGSMFTIKLPV